MANVKISQLPSLSTMTDAGEIPVVDSGTTQQITGANLKNYFTANVGFVDNTIYDLNGLTITNSDLSHGATATLSVPDNGNTASIQVTNTYGNFAVSVGAGAAVTSTLTFKNTGNLDGVGNLNAVGLSLSGNIVSPVRTTGNITTTANISGQYILGNGSQLTGINVSSNTIYNGNSNVQIPVANGNVNVNSAGSQWIFDTTGTMTFPWGANINSFDSGNITYINSASGTPAYPTSLNFRAYGSTANVPPLVSTSLNSPDARFEIHTFNVGTNTQYDWQFDDGGSLTLPNSPGNIYFGDLSNEPVIIPGATAITLNANRGDTTQDYIIVSQDGIDIFSVNNINIENNTTGFPNSDINIRAGDDILLQGRDRPADEEREGGDINISGGNGSDASANNFDAGGGGDLTIEAGLGGSGTGTGANGSSGGFVSINAGNGGTTVDAGVGSGGSINITAGAAATPVDPAFGGFGGDVTIRAGETTRVNEIGGSITLWTGASNGGGTGAAGYVEINIPSSNVGPGGTWTFSGVGNELNVPGDSSIYGASFGNFTVGCAGNTIVTSSDYGANVKNWLFGYTGNLVVPGPITQNSYDSANLLVATTADTNWAYGFTTNGSTDFYSQIKFYGDGSATRGAKILDSSTGDAWTFDGTGTLTFPSLANISGGNFNAGTASATVALNAFSPDGNTVSIQAQGNTSSAVISIFANAGPVTNNWVFTHAALDPTEAYLYVPGGASITTPNATGGSAGKNIFIEAGAADQGNFYTTAGGELFLKGGRGAFNDGGGGGPGGNVNINAGESADPAGHAGNVYITAGALQNWVFDYSGVMTAPGNITTTGNISGGYILGNGSQLTGLPANYGDSNVATLLSTFGSNTISSTGNITTTANIAGGNILYGSGIINGTGNITTTANIAGGNLIGTLVYGAGTVSGTGNITGGNLTTAGTLSATTAVLGNTATVTTGNYAIGYRDIPQVTLSANANAALTDAGKHFYSTTAGNLSILIPTNANVAFPTGAAFTVVVQAAGNVLINADGGVTLYVAGNSTSGNRVVSSYGMATVMKVATDTWFINGSGVS